MITSVLFMLGNWWLASFYYVHINLHFLRNSESRYIDSSAALNWPLLVSSPKPMDLRLLNMRNRSSKISVVICCFLLLSDFETLYRERESRTELQQKLSNSYKTIKTKYFNVWFVWISIFISIILQSHVCESFAYWWLGDYGYMRCICVSQLVQATDATL